MDGWVKLWRKSLNSGLIQNAELWTFWCWCLLKAGHKPRKQMIGWQEVHTEAGQFVFGRKKAAKELKMSEQTVRTCLKKLKNMENLTIKTTNKYSIIIINKWDSYQQNENENNQQDNQQATSRQPASNHKQELKNVKNKNKEICASGYSSDFEAWWTHYPNSKKIAKKKAWEAWKKATDKPGVDEMIQTLEAQKQSKQWIKEQGQYVPHPATYLNQGRWADSFQLSADPAQIQEKDKDWGQTFVPQWLQEVIDKPKQ